MKYLKQNLLFALTLLIPGIAVAQNAPTQVAEGSATIYRNNADGAIGQVYIYTGGTFPIGTSPSTLKFLWDFEGPAHNTTGVLTPLLLEEAVSGSFIIFKVVGIGKGFPAELAAAAVKIPFDIVVGNRITANRHTTFGFFNGLADANGIQYASTAGTVDYQGPQASGTGVGGPGTTNNWNATYESTPPSVALGTTFGAPGSGADYSFFGSLRTYSAEAYGFVKAH